MKDEQFKRANEIAEEISALIELKKEVSILRLHILINGLK